MAGFLAPRGTWETLVDQASARIRSMLSSDACDTIETKLLRVVEDGEQRMGSKPLWTLVDDEANKYVLKVAEPALMAAEQVAYQLRSLAGRPALPARVIQVNVDGIGTVEGLLKPYLEFEPALELDPHSSTWSELQRSVILLEHAWEWFLDNLDTNTSQYALLGPDRYPLNLDWDRAYAGDSKSELSRFAKYKPTLPNARTFLYADYVEGRVDLPFSLLRREARRIRRLAPGQVRSVVERYAESRHADAESAQALVARILERQSAIELDFERFIKSLLRERLRLTATGARSRTDLARNVQAVLWNDFQIVLNTVLRGPIGKFCRWLLKKLRSWAWSPSRPLALLIEAYALGSG